MTSKARGEMDRLSPDVVKPTAKSATDLAAFELRQREVVTALRTVVPERVVLFNEEDRRPYECDGLASYWQSETETPVRHWIELIDEALSGVASRAG